MKLMSRTCVNSKWPARFLALPDEEACECFCQCKVRVQGARGHVFVLTEDEIDRAELVARQEAILEGDSDQAT